MTKESVKVKKPKKLYTQEDFDKALEAARKTASEEGREIGFARGQKIGKHETQRTIKQYLLSLGWIGRIRLAWDLPDLVVVKEPHRFARFKDVPYILAEDITANSINADQIRAGAISGTHKERS